MGTRKPEDIRTVALVGHGGAGKTALSEAILFDTDQTTRMGSIESGNTVMDFDTEEHKRQISINSAVATIPYREKTLFILDTPGYADFIGDMRSSMRVADSVVTLVSAVDGVEVQTEKAWEFSEDFRVPVAFFVSKMNRENADFDGVVGQIQEYFTDKAVPFFLPIGSEASFKGLVDILAGKAYFYGADGSREMTEGEIPAEQAEQAQSARETLVERIVESDDELMMRYLEGEEIGMEELRPALLQAIIGRELHPVIPGDSTHNVGVYQLLQTIVDILPSPVDMPPRKVLDEAGEEVECSADPSGDFLALCFKIMVDPYVGKLSFIRVLSGTTTSDENIYNVNKEEDERVSSFRQMLGKESSEVKEIVPGDIVAIPKLHSTAVGDTMAKKGTKLQARPIDFPKPVFSLAVFPKSRGDEDKLANSVHRLIEEDPTLSYEKNPETRDNVLSGMGDQHLDVMLAHIKERYGVDLDTRTPRVPYRETIRKTAKAQGRYKKQSGGRGQYGDVHIEFAPKERGEGFEFVDKIVGGVVPKTYIPAVEKGLREAFTEGLLAGYPVVDIQATLFYGSYHDVDSSEMAFKIAASMAYKEAMKSTSPVLLEPIMNIEVLVPEDYLGDVMGDLNSRRGRIMGIDARGSLQVVKAQAPLAELFRYAIILRSMTSGRGNFTMEYSHYEEVPEEITRKVIEARQAEKEEG
ncbi:MAG: elongation factor G [Synergistales bacterium]|nr:elongation factor G [Synergistales bacterium]